MLVKERVLASRLILKLDASPDFAKQIGVSTALKPIKKEAKQKNKSIGENHELI